MKLKNARNQLTLLLTFLVIALVVLTRKDVAGLFDAQEIPNGKIITKTNPGDKPNIIFINVDDLGWKDVHYMQGYDHFGKATDAYDHYNFYHTPNIDKLANEGAIFTRGYAPAPICTPSRIACLTGQDAGRTRAHALITTISRIADRGGETIRLYPWVNRDSFDKNTITIDD